MKADFPRLTFPHLTKADPPLASMADHEADLQAACKVVMEQLLAHGIKVPADMKEEPLPLSTIERLKRMPSVLS